MSSQTRNLVCEYTQRMADWHVGLLYLEIDRQLASPLPAIYHTMAATNSSSPHAGPSAPPPRVADSNGSYFLGVIYEEDEEQTEEDEEDYFGDDEGEELEDKETEVYEVTEEKVEVEVEVRKCWAWGRDPSENEDEDEDEEEGAEWQMGRVRGRDAGESEDEGTDRQMRGTWDRYAGDSEDETEEAEEEEPRRGRPRERGNFSSARVRGEREAQGRRQRDRLWEQVGRFWDQVSEESKDEFSDWDPDDVGKIKIRVVSGRIRDSRE